MTNISRTSPMTINKFVEVTDKRGYPILLNVDCIEAVEKQATGEAVIYSVGRDGFCTSLPYEKVKNMLNEFSRIVRA